MDAARDAIDFLVKGVIFREGCHIARPDPAPLVVVACDLDHFSTLLMEKLRKLPAVKSIRSSFSLKAIKDKVAIALPI